MVNLMDRVARVLLFLSVPFVLLFPRRIAKVPRTSRRARYHEQFPKSDLADKHSIREQGTVRDLILNTSSGMTLILIDLTLRTSLRQFAESIRQQAIALILQVRAAKVREL